MHIRYSTKIRLLVLFSLSLSFFLSLFFITSLSRETGLNRESENLQNSLDSIFQIYNEEAIDSQEKIENLMDYVVDINRRVILQDVLEEDRKMSFFVSILVYALLQIASLLSLAFLASNRLTKPLNKLLEGAKIINGGDSSFRISPLTDPEHQKLSDTINSMLDNIQILSEQNAWKEVASFISHQYKNPLSTIQTCTATIQSASQLELPDSQAIISESTNLIASESKTLLRLINRLKTVSSFPPPSKEPLSLVSLVESLKKRYPNAEIAVQPKITRLFMLDKNYMEEIFKNLFNNSVEAAVPEQRVKIRVNMVSKDGEWLIGISDSHEGLSPDLPQKIMQTRYTTKKEGSGLGLTFVDKLIRLQGGRLKCELSNRGGLVFKIIFPGEVSC